MFHNAGKKIKGMADGLFAMQIGIGVLEAVVLFVISALASEDAVWIGSLLAGLFVLMVTPFVAWFSALLVYGFGEVVDTAIVNRQEEKVKIVTPPSPTAKKAPQGAAINGQWKCACGKVNSSETAICTWCGAAREIDHPSTELLSEEDDDAWIDVVCPFCGEKLSFLKGTTLGLCPNCDHPFNIG